MMKKFEAKHFLEAVISFGSEFNEHWKKNPKLKKKINSYFKASETFLKARYEDFNFAQGDNCIEKTPHFHFLIAPIYVEKDNNKEEL
jgi:hypothetical protein